LGEARTVLYVHGIGNKPIPSVLKCQWDQALFGFDLGERSRLAYWVNRDYYPQPESGTCRSGDLVELEAEPTGEGLSVKQHMQEAPLEDELAALAAEPPTPAAARTLRAMARRVEEGAARQEAAYAEAARRAHARGTAPRRAAGADVGDDANDADANGVRPGDVAAAADRLRAGRADDRAAARAAGVAAAGVGARLLPLPSVLRRWITRKLTRALLRDVNDFLFVEARRERMRESLRERLRVGGGPFVVVAHSQGSMVAYDVLSSPEFRGVDVRLLVTIGSPLGLQEVQDELKRLTGQRKGLRVPPGVRRWLNVADPLDPVAIDKSLAGDYPPNALGVGVEDDLEWNPDSPRHPHSGTGYLRTKPVQRAVRATVATGLFQPVADFVVARDVVRALENGGPRVRQPVLVELADPAAAGGRTLDAVRDEVVARILDLARATHARTAADSEAAGIATADPSDDDLRRALRLEPLRRFVSADLTREEAEALAAAVPGAADVARAASRVWRNARKTALLDTSLQTVQAAPAHSAYQATGRGIGWAVLDSGVNARHPHFAARGTVACHYDCTRPGPLAPLAEARAARPAAGDDNGHGTHVAGIIAGEHEAPAGGDAPAGERRRLRGVAPEATLFDYRVLDRDGNGEDAWIIKALDHIADTNERAGALVVHGVNLSLGGSFDQSTFGCGHTPLCNELRRLWRQGVLVVLAAGNEGFAVLQTLNGTVDANMDLSIGDPANLEEAIAVGSVHKAKPHTYGVSYFSSRGPTADGRQKPDLVAPGERVLSCRHRFAGGARASARDLYVEMSGTSMAAPHVSGVLAAFLSVRREFVGQPDRVKELLLQHCTDLKRDRTQQGAGMPNLVRMLVAT
jgi:subtilisin family serine protease